MSAILELLGKLLDAGKGLPRLRLDRKRKAILLEQLQDERYEFRTLSALSRAAGISDDEEARKLLVSIGARGSTGDGDEKWALISRLDKPKSGREQPTGEA